MVDPKPPTVKGVYGPNPGDGQAESFGINYEGRAIRQARERVIDAVDTWEEARAAHLLAYFTVPRSLAAQVQGYASFIAAVAAEEQLIAVRHSLRALLPHDAHSRPPHSPVQPVVHASVSQTLTAPDPAPPAPLVGTSVFRPVALRQLAVLLPARAEDTTALQGWFVRNGDIFALNWNNNTLLWKVAAWKGAHHFVAEDKHLIGALAVLALAVLRQANYHGNESERL